MTGDIQHMTHNNLHLIKNIVLVHTLRDSVYPVFSSSFFFFFLNQDRDFIIFVLQNDVSLPIKPVFSLCFQAS